MEAIIQISQLVGPVIGSLLLQIGVFTPFPISLSLALLSVPLALILPSGAVQSVQDSSLSNDPQERLPLLNPSYPDTPSTPPHEVELTTRLGIAWKDVRDFGLIFKTNQVARYASFAFLIVTLGKQSLHILLQYVSKRFHVSIAAVSLLKPPVSSTLRLSNYYRLVISSQSKLLWYLSSSASYFPLQSVSSVSRCTSPIFALLRRALSP